VIAGLEAQGVKTRKLNVSHAFHSPLMEPMLNAFEHTVSQIAFQTPCIPLISNLTGQMLPQGYVPDASYWRRHAREVVKFTAGMNTLFEQGYELFLELGPKPILSSLGKQYNQGRTAVWLSSLTQGKDDWQILLESLSALYVLGIDINWNGFHKNYSQSKLPLPTYPFQRKRYWIKEADILMDENKLGAKASDQKVDALPKTTRRDTIVSTLRYSIANVLQTDPSDVDLHTSFMEIGADSIAFLDFALIIENTYGLKITIHQLFEDLTTINALATYIDNNISPEWTSRNSSQNESMPEAQLQKLALQNSTIASAEPRIHSIQDREEEEKIPETTLEKIMNHQLQVMSQQLEVLRKNSLSTVINSTNRPQQNQIAEVTPCSAQIKLESDQKHSRPSSSHVPWGSIETRVRELSPRQQHHLEALIKHYTKRTQKSKQLTQNYRSVMADKRATIGFRLETKEMLYPIIGQRAQGAKFLDVDGNEYVDITMGFGAHLFGHGASFITTAVENQLKQGIAFGPQSNFAGEVAELICELTGMERVAFCNSGTEAIMAVLRVARATTGRDKIALFANSYHGHFDGTLVIPQSVDGKIYPAPMVSGVPQNIVNDVLVLNYGDPGALDIIQAHAHELAGVLVEPVQSRQPNLQPKAFLQQLRQLTKEKGIPLIFDEILLGFRIHPGGAQAWFDVKADLVTYGKVIGGGMPIGVLAGSATFMDKIDGGMWSYGDISYPNVETTFFGGTFCKHPLAMAAAGSVLKHLKMQGSDLQHQLNQRTSQFAETLNAYFDKENVPIQIVHFGSFFRFASSGNLSYAYQPLELDLLFYHLIQRGVYAWEGRTCFLSTAHSNEDIEHIIQAVKDSVESMREGGFWDKSSSKFSKGEN